MVQYASSYLTDKGWGDIKIDKRNLRRVEGMWPGGRAYQLKVAERIIPEDVVERMFQSLDSLDTDSKRLLILDRYTGMRSLDLHALDFDCLKDDPDDPRFMILTFYQSKVKRWNTKPLLKEDAAHALVIKTIKDQQEDVCREWGRKTKYLFQCAGVMEKHTSQPATPAMRSTSGSSFRTSTTRTAALGSSAGTACVTSTEPSWSCKATTSC